MREADRGTIPEVAKRNGASEASICAWRTRFGGNGQRRRETAKARETGNLRLKKLVAERDLEIEVMKTVSVKNSERTGSRGANSLESFNGKILRRMPRHGMVPESDRGRNRD